MKNLKTNKKVNWDSLDFDTVVVSDLTGLEYKVSSIYRDAVILKDEYNHEYKRKEVSWKDLEVEFDWVNKYTTPKNYNYWTDPHHHKNFR